MAIGGKNNSFQEFQKDLKSGKINGTIILCGQEEFIANWALDLLVKNYVNPATITMDYVSFEAKEMSIEALSENIETLPMFSEKKIIVIRGYRNQNLTQVKESLEKISEKAIIVFMGDEVDKEIVKVSKKYEFHQLDSNQLIKFIEKRFREENILCSRGVLKNIAAESGYYNNDIDYNLYNLIGDIKKIVALTKSHNMSEVTIDIVRNSMSDTIEHGIFKMIDAIGNKRKDISLDLLNQLILSGESEYTILGAVISQLEVMLITKELIEMGHRKEDIQKMTKIHAFRIQKSMNITRNYQSKTIKNMLKMAYETDMRIKKGLLDSKTAMELLIGEI